METLPIKAASPLDQVLKRHGSVYFTNDYYEAHVKKILNESSRYTVTPKEFGVRVSLK